jgi:hypothetical protein
LDARGSFSGPITLSKRCLEIGEGDRDERRGRAIRGERLRCGDGLSRLGRGGDCLRVEIGERRRRGERDLAGRGARLRLLSLARVEWCPCDLSLDRLGEALGRRIDLPGETLLIGSSRLGRLSGECDRLRGRCETGL